MHEVKGTPYNRSKLDETRFAIFPSMDAWRKFMRARVRMGESMYIMSAHTRNDGTVKIEYGVC